MLLTSKLKFMVKLEPAFPDKSYSFNNLIILIFLIGRNHNHLT